MNGVEVYDCKDCHKRTILENRDLNVEEQIKE